MNEGASTTGSAAFDVTSFEASLEEGRRQRQRWRSESRRSLEVACPGHHSPQDVQDIWAFQDGKCYFCLQPLGAPGEADAFVKDHLIPVRDWFAGSQWPHNIALTCVHCNTEKHHRTERQYWALLKKTVAAERYEMLSRRAKELKKLKRPLTVRRKKDRQRGLQELQQAIETRVNEKLLAGSPRNAAAPDLRIEDGQTGTSIEIIVDSITLTLPGLRGGLNSARRWLAKYGNAVVAAITALDALNPPRRA
jgi:hypothetical protein